MKIHSQFGVTFHGALGKSMIAEEWKGINYIKRYAVPRNPRTPRQQRGRSRFADAVRAWQVLAREERETYAREARDLGCSGYNLFLSRFLAADAAKAGTPQP